MISGWRRPRASRFAGVGRRALWLVLAAMAGGASIDVCAREAGIELRFAAGAGVTVRERGWLTEDADWLARTVPAGSGSATELAALRKTVAAGSAPESDPGWGSLAAGLKAGDADSVVSLRLPDDRLRDRWFARGYLSANVVSRGDTLVVTPGPMWTIGGWDIGGDAFPGRERLLATWLPGAGARFVAAEIERGVERVLRGVGEAGHPFPRWVVRKLQTDAAAHEVRILASLIPGTRAHLGSVTCDLESPRARRFLVRASGLARGDPFDQAELVRVRQRLLARDLYTTVAEPVVYATSAVDTVGVHLAVTPRRKQNRLQVVVGVSRREDGSGGRLSGEVDLWLPNLAGTGRSLRVGWRDDGADRSRFGFAYREPLAFGTPLDTELNLDQEVQQDAFMRFRVNNVWRLPVVALWGVELGVGRDRVTYPVGSLARSNRTRARGAVLHRRGDRTRSGWQGLFAVETARRSATPRQDDDGGSLSRLAEDQSQRIYEVDAGAELWFGRTLSLAGRASFRQLQGGERTAPVSEQFRFGGAASLRGYREQEFRGTEAAWAGLELRLGPPLGSRLYTFWDVGYFELWAEDPLAAVPDAPESRLRRRGWPRGFGLGLLALTPGGDISLAVGFPGTIDFDLAKLHVTLLESF